MSKNDELQQIRLLRVEVARLKNKLSQAEFDRDTAYAACETARRQLDRVIEERDDFKAWNALLGLDLAAQKERADKLDELYNEITGGDLAAEVWTYLCEQEGEAA